MLIKKKYIRSVERYLNAIRKNGTIKLVFKVTPETQDLVNRIGFSSPLHTGDTILPNKTGNTSRFNAEGKYLKLKNRPKESRYINTIEWSWEQWCGKGQTETITEYRDVYRQCYQQKFMPPPSIEITWVELNGEYLLTSPNFDIANTDNNLIKHVINLFLELFGECEIRKDDLTSFTSLVIKRVNWSMLPPGKYPWEKVHSHVKQLVSNKHSRYSNVILDRQDALTKYKPNEVYVGTGGFSSYVAYVFKSKKLVILESVEEGNATYIFGENWKEFSMLTKAEVLENQHHKERLIHSNGWEFKLQSILEPERQLVV